MPTAITLKNIPDEIYDRLKIAASAHHRSLNMEVIACLEQVLIPTRKSPEEIVAAAREIRARLKGRKFKARDIERAINSDRP